MALLESIRCGAILLDKSGFVIELNQHAAQLEGGVLIQNQRLHASDADSDQRLQTLLDTVLVSEPGARAAGRAMRITRPGRRPLALRVLPVEDGSERPHGGAHAIVLVFDPEEAPKPDELLVRQVFGLTPAEWRIAERLIGGDSLDDIATGLGVTVSTVRTQLKSIFAKTLSHRQTELVASLIQLTRFSNSG